MLLYITKPSTSLPEIMIELERFGACSNFKVNITKSEAMAITKQSKTLVGLKKDFPFVWSQTHIKYLGVMVPRTAVDTYALNHNRLLQPIKKDLEDWGKLHFSWFGKASVIKMNVLTRLLYIVQVLLCQIPNVFYAEMQKMITKFLGGRRYLGETKRWNRTPRCENILSSHNNG